MRFPSELERYTVDEVIETINFGDDREQVEKALLTLMPNAYSKPVYYDDPYVEEYAIKKIWSKLPKDVQTIIDRAAKEQLSYTWSEPDERDT